MNYRHAFHAGNFADVFKHAVLARLIDYLKRKEGAFRVVDTHAGIGRYDLQASEATRTGEWQGGIARLMNERFDPDVEALLQPYRSAVDALNPDGNLRYYPGSPLVSRYLLRKQDRLSALELHPQDADTLRSVFTGDHQVRVIELDGWLSMGAHLPPKEKRGLVLVDPPFEQPGEFDRMAEGLLTAHRRWPGGIYAFWYPIKDLAAVQRYRESLAALGIPKILDTWLTIRGSAEEAGLIGSGMAIINPPFTLEQELATLLPALCECLAEDQGASSGTRWIAREHR
ncbi:23S rRNA (adenine(2030)-N(6))-methyltransferase RlmJ [Tianweitania sp. BSSL-BM11]|uniref:Ribosomal RNA large subunit methyltransferase J n=1 Tax=Tianweitania aestuarii TaxID=2814886 RepID=A0ABS5RUK9_9HYPH|nr:23S rRNA (adenine(2030)-N(6))-methyltransferase RlmJ [Tianweitania aestuarii]MBS9720017.1 23S rRNA (adenine(2030)-N(6))-methyltransferase RlmJ [Tianweitania aestuarii]